MARFDVIESKHWVRDDGRTASIYGAVPWVSPSEEKRWKIISRGYTVRDNERGTVGIGRQPWSTRAEAQAWVDKETARLEEARRWHESAYPKKTPATRTTRSKRAHAAKKTASTSKQKEKRLHFAGYDFTSGPEGTVVRRPAPDLPGFRPGDRVKYDNVNLWQEGTVTGADGKWITVRWDGYSFESREWAPNLRHVSTGTAHATKKKSPAQLQREIDEVLARPTTASKETSVLPPSVRVARAGLESMREHGIRNLRYGLYRHAGDRAYQWGNFTGTPEHVITAVVPNTRNTASQEALVRALKWKR